MASDISWTKIKLLELQAGLLKDSFDEQMAPDILHAKCQDYMSMLALLKATLPNPLVEHIEDKGLGRHSYWLERRLREGKPEGCYSDLKTICAVDIPALEQAYALYQEAGGAPENPDYNWVALHPMVREQAKSRFESKHYADAVEAAFKEINHLVKTAYQRLSNKEKDGDALMREAFTCTPNNNYTPHLRLTDRDLSSESGRNVQEGYMNLFAGAMRGIRNPKAHANITIDATEAWEMLVFASHLMRMWDRGQKAARLAAAAQTA